MGKLTRYDFSVAQSKTFLWLYCITLGQIKAIHWDCVEYLHRQRDNDEWEESNDEDDIIEGDYIKDFTELSWWQQDEFLAHNWEQYDDGGDAILEILENEELFQEIPMSFRKNDYTKYMTDKELSIYLGDEPENEDVIGADSWKTDAEYLAA